MKLLMSLILIPAVLVISLANAEPRAQEWKVQRTLTTQDDFESLKSGDRLAMTCKACDAMSIREVKSKADAQALCEEGNKLSCPACKYKATVEVRGPRPENPRSEIRYVDQHGKACMVLTKIKAHRADGGSIHRGPETAHRTH